MYKVPHNTQDHTGLGLHIGSCLIFEDRREKGTGYWSLGETQEMRLLEDWRYFPLWRRYLLFVSIEEIDIGSCCYVVE